jgi:predicted MFS family arabinose efflux permease
LPSALVLFLSLFAAQAPVFVLAPMLPHVAEDFSIPVSVAGQLRAISGLVAAITAVKFGFIARGAPLRQMIASGLFLIPLGSLAAALAPAFWVLVAAQVAVGLGLGTVVTGGTAATADWVPAAGHSRLLSWTLMGPPAAAIVATLAAGVLADLDWRLAWLAPLGASIIAVAAVRTRPAGHTLVRPRVSISAMWRVPRIAGWALGEVLAYSSWSGVTVYAGALLIQSYKSSPGLAALAICGSAVAVVGGNLVARRWVARSSRALLLVCAIALSGTAGLFGVFRPAFWVSALVLVVAGFLAGGRALAGTAFGLQAAPDLRLAVMGVRTTAQQLSYLLGAGLGGAALGVGGYGGMGALLRYCSSWPPRRTHSPSARRSVLPVPITPLEPDCAID